MPSTTLQQQLAFLHEIDKLKYIFRKTTLINNPTRFENDAEHSWHLCVMAMVLQEHAHEPIDLLRVIKMLLIHDIVEIDAGDTFFFDPARAPQQSQAEEAAAERIFGLLPADQKAAFRAIWMEFEAGTTPEAKYAKAIDRIEPVFQNLSNGGGTWKEHQVPLSVILKKLSVIAEGAPLLWKFTENSIRTALAKGQISVGPEPNEA
ncbi:MAG: HD domain-containing protein [Sphingobacteriaceae bacterium]|nr:HD domain-containing protein [Sphingobacteriaceae bacterium]